MSTSNTGTTGRDIYNYRCYFCHGYSGDAKTLASTFLDPVPRAFTATDPATLDRKKMLNAVRHGVPKSAMMSFSQTLSEREIEAVVDFVRDTFMVQKKANTKYHTDENGWQNHERYTLAYPFVQGDIALDAPSESLSEEQKQGRALFMSSCVSCHDRVEKNAAPLKFESSPLSFPRNGYSHKTGQRVDSVSAATPYSIHDRAPELLGLGIPEKLGESLYQKNCAFCHAMDGTGKNWIGQFLQPHPRNFTSHAESKHLDNTVIREAIRHGVVNSAMPAWQHVLSEQEIDALARYVQHAFLAQNAAGVFNGKHL